MMLLSDGEAEPRAIMNTRGYSDLHGMAHEREPAATALHTRLGPRLTAAAARSAETLHGHLQWNRDSTGRVALVQLHRSAEHFRALVGKKRPPHAFDCRRHRRKVDDDLIGEPVAIVARVVASHNSCRLALESSVC